MITVVEPWTTVLARSRRSNVRAKSGTSVGSLLSSLSGQLLGLTLSLVVAGLVLWSARSAAPTSSPSALLLAGGRAAGVIGGVLLFVQVLLMSRLGWLDRRISTLDLHAAHRDIGALLTVTVLAHVILALEGTAVEAQVTPLVQLRRWLAVPELVSAMIAMGILLLLGLLAARAVRAMLPYELWYLLHLTSYAILVLAYAHEFVAGSDMARSPAVRTMWTVLYAVTAAGFIWGRVVAPIRLNLRHRLRVAGVRPEGPDAFSIYVTGRRLELPGQPGQFFRWRFLTAGCWWQAHPFSLSAAPNGRWLRCTVKMVGRYTEALHRLQPGVRVLVAGPAGTSTPSQRTRRRALLIAGGSGIAQARALLEGLPARAVVIYRAQSRGEVILDRELARLAETRAARIFYIMGARDDPGPASAMTAAGLRSLVPDLLRRDVFICGSEGLTRTVVDAVNELRLPRRQMHLEPVEF